MNGKIYFLVEKSTGDKNYYYNLYEYTPGTSGVKQVMSNIPQSSKVRKVITSKGIRIRTSNCNVFNTAGAQMN